MTALGSLSLSSPGTADIRSLHRWRPRLRRAPTPQESLVLLATTAPARIPSSRCLRSWSRPRWYAGARIRVRLDDSRDVRTRDTGIGIRFRGAGGDAGLVERLFGEIGPGDRRGRVPGGHRCRFRAVEQVGLGVVVAREQRRLRAQQVSERVIHPFKQVSGPLPRRPRQLS